MFEKVGQRAEEIATRLPRRAFFGKVAQAAVPVAAALAGFLALPGITQGLGRGPLNCCYDENGAVCNKKTSETCPEGTLPGQCPQFGKKPGLCY